MNKILIICILTMLSINSHATSFEDFFEDKTLRIDYIFAGNDKHQDIYVDQLTMLPKWYGKRQRLDAVPLKGNGQIIVRSQIDGRVIYRHSFSTLFQEWLATAESKRTQKSFENVFLIPWPKYPIDVTVELYDNHGHVTTNMNHSIDPTDILIRRGGEIGITPYSILQQAADTSRCIRIAYVAEGYQTDEMSTFLDDCKAATASLFAHEPFGGLRDRFNIVAVMSPSADSGTSEPSKGIWKDTALGSHFDTFYSDRYLTTLHLKRLHDVLAGIPYEHIIILVNTEHYGGGGIYNSYNLSYTRGRHFKPVVVHEFGHSFGGLGDEYDYGNDAPTYFADTEPWEPNLTTRHDFGSKWEKLQQQGKAGLVEGGGYMKHGVWRAFDNCRMRTNEEPEFCLVCREALTRLIEFYTKP